MGTSTYIKGLIPLSTISHSNFLPIPTMSFQYHSLVNGVSDRFDNLFNFNFYSPEPEIRYPELQEIPAPSNVQLHELCGYPSPSASSQSSISTRQPAPHPLFVPGTAILKSDSPTPPATISLYGHSLAGLLANLFFQNPSISS